VGTDRPAIEGGQPIREQPLPYGRHRISDDDVHAVEQVLRSDWLTTGPTIEAFEGTLRAVTGAAGVVAVSSGTAALHAACATLGLAPGDEVIVPSLTFVASANAILYVGGRPVFAEVRPDTFTIDPDDVERRLTSRTRAIMTVHYAGLATDLGRLRALTASRGLVLVEDAAHALGASTEEGPVGARSDLATFSFHPVKHVTTGEGGAIATTSAERAAAMRRFRNHGLSSDVREREGQGDWAYDLVDFGFNYRLSDIGAALGRSQLGSLPQSLARRRALARAYRSAFADVPELELQSVQHVDAHAWHLFVVAIKSERLRVGRDQLVRALRAEGIVANVHYAPAHLMRYYREHLGTAAGMLPVTEDVASRLITLPLFPAMSDHDLADVVTALRRCVDWYRA